MGKVTHKAYTQCGQLVIFFSIHLHLLGAGGSKVHNPRAREKRGHRTESGEIRWTKRTRHNETPRAGLSLKHLRERNIPAYARRKCVNYGEHTSLYPCPRREGLNKYISVRGDERILNQGARHSTHNMGLLWQYDKPLYMLGAACQIISARINRWAHLINIIIVCTVARNIRHTH